MPTGQRSGNTTWRTAKYAAIRSTGKSVVLSMSLGFDQQGCCPPTRKFGVVRTHVVSMARSRVGELPRRPAAACGCRAIAVSQCNALVGLAAWQHGGRPEDQVCAWPRTRPAADHGRATRGSQGREYVDRRRGRTRYKRSLLRRRTSGNRRRHSGACAPSWLADEPARKWPGLLACRVAAPPATWSATYARSRSFVTSCAGRGRLQSGA